MAQSGHCDKAGLRWSLRWGSWIWGLGPSAPDAHLSPLLKSRMRTGAKIRKGQRKRRERRNERRKKKKGEVEKEGRKEGMKGRRQERKGLEENGRQAHGMRERREGRDREKGRGL